MDIYQICLNEVALEGLDGITVSALWLRLNSREEKIGVTLSPILQEILWKFLLQHSCIEFFQIASERSDPVIFNRYLGIDVATGKHVAVAPDELDLMQNIYYVKPVANQSNIRGSCTEFDSRINVSNELKDEDMSLDVAMERYGKQQLVIVASQCMRESVLRGPGVAAQTIESLTDIEYCILERIGRSRWQGELQTVLNNYVFKQLKSAHIHYMMKSLFQKGLITKQPYSYVRDDKNGKVYQQILLHLPHFKTDARSVSDIRAETVCEMLKQTDNHSILCNDLRQIVGIEGKTFRKLIAKMITSGFVKVESLGTTKNCDKLMTLLKTPSEKQDEDIMDDPVEEEAESNVEGTGLVSELPLTLQGYRHIFSTGENGCSQGDLNHKLKGYGSLEARHLCRKVEKAKIVKIIMIDHGKQRTQKYIADNFAHNSRHTKQFFEEQKKMKKILKTSDSSISNDSSVADGIETSAAIVDDNDAEDHQASLTFDGNNGNSESDILHAVSQTAQSESSEICLHLPSSRNDCEVMVETDQDFSVKRSKWDTHQTARKMRRTNTILTYVNEHKIVEGFFELQKILQAEEKDEGLTTKVCKKTVKRLVQKLHNDGLIKHFCVPITSNDCTVEVDFVMSLDCDSMRLKTAIEQAQFKKFSDDSKKIAMEQVDMIDLTSPTFVTSGLHNSMRLSDVKTEDTGNKQNNKLQYGYQPKFLRNQVVHEYLWYLAYGHPLNGKENYEMFNYDKIKEYSTEKNWKRFLPPAPCHPSFGPGWLQVGDAAVLLPLSILCQFHQYTYKIDGLDQYIGDPARKTSLVRHLPVKIKGLMFHKRKYLFSLIQVIENLCFMGLVSFNKQRRNVNMRSRKESEMIYVHRNATVVDTRKSEKGYSEVSEGIQYEKLHFQLDDFADVEKYWSTLKDVSLMTPLGVRGNDEAENETGTRHAVKLKLFVADHVAREKWKPADDGTIPGDQKGAGGLDSSLFVHLYRNWFRPVKVNKNAEHDFVERLSADGNKEKPHRLPKLVPTVLTLTEENAKKTKRRSRPSDADSRKRAADDSVNKSAKRQKLRDEPIIIDDEDFGDSAFQSAKKQQLDDESNLIAIEDSNDPDYEIVTESNVGRNHRVKGGRGRKRPVADLVFESKRVRRRGVRVKEVTKPKKKGKYTDVLDLKALSNMNGRTRVAFSKVEDEVLLICRIAATLVAQNIRVKRKSNLQNVVSGIMIRDLLWRICPDSKDKTSYAVRKRMNNLMKSTNSMMFHDVTIAEMQNDEVCMNELFDSMIGRELEETQEVEALFNEVYEEVQRKFREDKLSTSISLPDTIQEIDSLFVTKVFTTSKEPMCRRVLGEVSESRDIVFAVLENLMYMALSLNEDEFSQYQAYKIFEKYPNAIIAEVWHHIKASGIICKRPDMYLNRQRHLPFAVPVFHLSKSHFQYLQAGSMWKVFSELLSSWDTLVNAKTLVCDMNTTSGAVIITNVLFLDETENYEVVCPNLQLDVDDTASSQTSASQETNGEELDVGDDDYDEGKEEVKELFHLYRRQRFEERIQNDKSKSLKPIVIHNKSNFGRIFDENIESDIHCMIRHLESVKLSSKDDVILLEEGDRSASLKTAVENIANEAPALSAYVEKIVSAVDESGEIGISLCDLKKNLLMNSSVDCPDELVSKTVELLQEHKVIYLVGMWHERAVLECHAHRWVVEGSVFKGDRNYLRNEIRKELSQTTSKYETAEVNPEGHKWNEEIYAVYKNSIPINTSSSTTDTPATDIVVPNHVAVTASKRASWILSDPANYEQVKFFCRPWHNVSGEVNYRTAKLLLTGVFVHILWHPGITLANLTEHFIVIMQRTSLIELVQKLILGKCIERRKLKRRTTWQLFTPLQDDIIENVTSNDGDYYHATADGIFRMTVLCSELDKLQEERNSSLIRFEQDSSAVQRSAVVDRSEVDSLIQ